MQLELEISPDLSNAKDFNPKRKEIARSNEFINGKYKLSLVQSKILLLVSSQVQMGDKVGKVYTIPIAEILKGTKSKNYNYVVEQARSLQGQTIEIKDQMKNGRQMYKSINLFYQINYTKERSGNIYFVIHPDLKPHFLDLKEYTKFIIDHVFAFKSEHSLRIYELLKEYWNKGLRQRAFSLDDFKAKLGIPNKYVSKNAKGEKVHNWGEIRRNILLKAKKDFETCADIDFEIVPKKNGVKVVGFNLEMFLNEKNAPKIVRQITVANNEIDQAFIDQLKGQYPEELIKMAIAKASADKNIQNPKGWVTKALKEGYFLSELEQLSKKKQKQQKQAKQQEASRKLQQRIEVVQEEYKAFWEKRCQDFFTLYENKIEVFLEDFQKAYGHDPKTRETIELARQGNFTELVRKRLGNFILQQKGAPEEKDFKSYAKLKYDLEID